jgi:predicted DNA-binding WGR domain protein
MDEGSTIQHTLVLRRLEPEQNVDRFYALMIERDLFGPVVLVRRWGRIGTRGRERSDPHASESEAAAAMAQIAAVKRRRGTRTCSGQVSLRLVRVREPACSGSRWASWR